MKKTNWIFVAIIASITAIGILYSVFPVHPDEINLRFYSTRVFYDSWQFYSYQRPCLDGPIPYPYSLRPLAAVWAFFDFVENYRLIRLIDLGAYILYALSLAVVLRYLCGLSQFNAEKIFLIFLWSFFLTASAVWNASNRIEFSIFYLLSCVQLIFAIKTAEYGRRFYLPLYLITIFICLSIGLGHPKALYFLPALFVLGLYLRIDRFAFLGIVAGSIFVAYKVAGFNTVRFLECPEYPDFQLMMNSLNISPLLAITDVDGYLKIFLQGLHSHIDNLFGRVYENLTYRTDADIGYLPPVHKVGYLLNMHAWFIKTIYYTLLHLAVLQVLAVVILYKKTLKLERPIRYFIYIQSSVLIAVLIIIFHNRTSNAYDSQFWYVLLVGLVFSSILVYYNQILNNKLINSVLFVIGIVFILNGSLYYKYYYKTFVNQWSEGNFAGPSVPVKYFEESKLDKLRSQIAAYKEGIGNSLLLFDDRTYLSVKNLPNIAPITYTMLVFYHNGRTPDAELSLARYFDSKKVVFMYVACEFLPELPAGTALVEKFDNNICLLEWRK